MPATIMHLALLLLPTQVLCDYHVATFFSTPSCTAGSRSGGPIFTTGNCMAGPFNMTSMKLSCSAKGLNVYSGTSCSGDSISIVPLSTGCDGNGNNYSCVSSSAAVPDVSALGAVVVNAYVNSCTAPDLSSATKIATIFPSGCQAVASSAPGAPQSYQYLCGTWGAGMTYYSDAACKTQLLSSPIALPPSNFTCTQSSGGPLSSICLSPVAASSANSGGASGAANSGGGTFSTCGGATLPLPLTTQSLSCYTGEVSSTGAITTYLTPVSGSSICVAATYKCSNSLLSGSPICKSTPSATIRMHTGMSPASDISSFLNGAADVFACTSSLCNAPSTDSCRIAAPAYTPLTCSAVAITTTASTVPIKCYSNLAAGGVPVLQTAAVAGSAFCVATTVSCPGAGGASPLLRTVCNSSTAGAVRIYSGALFLGGAAAVERF